MSLEAMVWVLNCDSAPDPLARWVLMGLANHADRYGRNSFPGQTTLAQYAQCSDRSVRRKLDELEKDSELISRGDQELVSHYPANRRPVVWDLAMTLPGQAVRPDTAVSGQGPGLTGQDRRLDRTLLSDKPSLNQVPPYPPSAACSRHQGAELNERCRGCRTARQTAAQAAEKTRRAEERSAAARIIAAAIAECGLCDRRGRLPNGNVCIHDPLSIESRAKTGAEYVRQTMGWV